MASKAGDVSEFHRELNARGRPYLLEVMSSTAVWPLGTGPQAPTQHAGKRGRPQQQITSDAMLDKKLLKLFHITNHRLAYTIAV